MGRKNRYRSAPQPHPAPRRPPQKSNSEKADKEKEKNQLTRKTSCVLRPRFMPPFHASEIRNTITTAALADYPDSITAVLRHPPPPAAISCLDHFEDTTEHAHPRIRR